MTRNVPHLAVCVAALVTIAGCESTKSANPLSPTVAGPIPGVNISPPKLLEPGQGWKFKDSQQPLTLLIENASSNGVRPIRYGFQIATDPDFKAIVFTKTDVDPGPNGRTALRLTNKLPVGRSYNWRAWAYDGANTGPMTAVVTFELYAPAVILAPVPTSPVGGGTADAVQPELRVRNSGRSGPVGNVSYRFEVARDQSFVQVVTGTAGQPENGNGVTGWRVATPLEADKTYFWRAMGHDNEASSPWSAVQAFKTPAAPTGGGGDGGGGSPAPCGPPYPNTGDNIVRCVQSKYPGRLAAGVSLSTRIANMQFLRDRMIETGTCGGLILGRNSKRGGPEISNDFIVQRTSGGDRGIDIASGYDDTSRPLRLQWLVYGPPAYGHPSWAGYPAVSCP